MELISAKGLCKSYRRKQVLFGINFSVQSGEIYGLVGNNGAGKTTLLKLLCNMLRPTAGTVTVNAGQFRSKVRIGALIERPAYYFDMTAYQNIEAKALALGVKYSSDDIFGPLRLVGLHDTGKKDVRAF